MRNLVLTLGLLAAVAAGAWFGVFRTMRCDEACAAAREGDALGWLRAEFRLSDAQYAAIAKLHEEQSVRCAVHCAEVGRTRDSLAAAERRGDAAAVAAARAAERAAIVVCETSVEAHVRAVAALMPAGEGERYLALVLPKIATMTHAGAPDVRLDH